MRGIFFDGGNILEQRTITITRNEQRPIKKPRSLFKEYLRRWYVFFFTLLMCLPAYVCEVLLYNIFVMKDITAFLAALMAIFIGGFVATIPLLIVNIKLIVKKKKYYAIVVQIALTEIIGMAIFILSQI